MKRIRVGLNGFGRIGRAFTRIALLRNSFDIVAINTRKTPTNSLAYLLQYDSVYRKFGKPVKAEGDILSVGDVKIQTTLSPDPEQIQWDKYQVDVVLDATGAFKTKQDLGKHLKGSVKKVIVTVDSSDQEVPHIVMGVNDDKVDFSTCNIVSNCTCTTNCSAIMFKVLDDNFKVLGGFLSTTHAYTQTQNLLDD